MLSQAAEHRQVKKKKKKKKNYRFTASKWPLLAYRNVELNASPQALRRVLIPPRPICAQDLGVKVVQNQELSQMPRDSAEEFVTALKSAASSGDGLEHQSNDVPNLISGSFRSANCDMTYKIELGPVSILTLSDSARPAYQSVLVWDTGLCKWKKSGQYMSNAELVKGLCDGLVKNAQQ